MAPTRFTQYLASSRWAPHKAGALASLPIIAVMLLLWSHKEIVAILWFCLYSFLGGLWIFHTTPIRKMISTALTLGTLVPFMIMFAR